MIVIHLSGVITLSIHTVLFFLVSYLDMNEYNGVQSPDVFRDSRYCEGESCPLNLRNTKVVLELLRKTLKMYREEFHIDGIRWITRQGDHVVGGTCSTSEVSDPENDRLLQDFWVDIKSFGFIIVYSVFCIHN